MNKRGIVLIEIVIIIVLLAIIALGIVSYISEGLRFNIANINQQKALYMAQAGIMRSIVDYRDNGLWSSVQNVDMRNESYYHLGRNANFLWVDASNPQISTKKLKRIPIQNINSTSPITITNMVVSWTFGGTIKKVTLGGSSVWSGNTGSPASLNITDFEIASGTSYTGSDQQIWEFSRNVTGDVIVTFIFSDGSSYKTYILKSGTGANKEFSITATGEVRNGANVVGRRTLVATYDTGTNKITSWEESQNHIIP